ncbi:MAG: anthrone oxygenase family protein, partial [Methyloceanibacter sp.]
LNNQLAFVRPDSEAGAKVWKTYLPTWSLWNHVRVATALAAAACFIMALVRQAA